MKQYRMRIKATLLIGLFVLIGGCAEGQYQQYSGDDLAESTRATLKPWENGLRKDSPGSLFVIPESIDGKHLDAISPDDVSETTYFISPGERAVRVILLANIGGEMSALRNPEPMIFLAETGHVYATKAFYEPPKQGVSGTTMKLGFWIEDENTGEVVSGTRPTQ